MLTCPHCGARTVSPLRKLFVGPLFSNPCPACGKAWAISTWSVAVAMAAVALYLAFMVWVQPSRPLALVAGLGLLAASAVVIVHWLPVVRR